MALRVFVTGGSGFVGSAIITQLVARQHWVHALVHRRKLDEFGPAVHSFVGDLFDPHLLDRAMAGCDAVIHLVGIIVEHPLEGVTFQRIHFDGARSVIDAAIRNNVNRFIHMSALGARFDAVSTYHKTKYAAEEYLRGTNLDWTIFRPSMIHGARGEFMQMEAKWARRKAPPFLFMPYFGAGLFGFGGAGMLQPVYVNDLARAFVDALENDNTIGETYPIGGADRITWPQLHRTVARAVVGHPRWVMPIPVWKAKLLAAIGVGKLAGFNWDQIVMSQEDNTCDLTKFVHDFRFTPAGFEETLRSYTSQL